MIFGTEESAMAARIALGVAVVLATAWGAFGKDARVGTATLALPPPPGFCELSEQQASDARMIQAITSMLAGQNELLAMSAECRQLADWRTGRRPLLDDFSQYQTLVNAKDREFPRAEMVKEICASLRAEGEKTLSGLTPDIKARAETVLKDVKFNETRFLGVLAENSNACYFALLQKLKTEAGTEKTQVTLATVTILKGKIVYFYTYALYVNGETVTALLAKHQSNVTALLSANGG
jgi:hypothetical protein